MGVSVTLTVKPAAVGEGLRFVRTDLGSKIVRVSPETAVMDPQVTRCTAVEELGVRIYTIEHLLAAASGLGLDNLILEISGEEVPGMDGSSRDFVEAFKKAGMVEQNASKEFMDVQETITVANGSGSVSIVPADDFKVSYTLDYDHPYLKSQFFSAVINAESFEKHIAPCRTFCLESEVNDLRTNGLGKGANYKNTLVVGDKGVIDNKVRFPDEFVRHKILDFVGDLYLLGMPITGHVYAVRSGHTLNIRLMNEILEQKARYERKGIAGGYDITGKREICVEEIMKILPHRYPFLFVDRVIEIEKGKRVVGIKNVTMNDNFFQGHFPTRPVMPGVLMIEAMAQTGGVAVLTGEEHRGKVAFFLAVDNVKFRKVVVPGDQLIMEVEVVKDKSRTASLHAVTKVNGEIAAEADMVFSFTDASYLDA